LLPFTARTLLLLLLLLLLRVSRSFKAVVSTVTARTGQFWSAALSSI